MLTNPDSRCKFRAAKGRSLHHQPEALLRCYSYLQHCLLRSVLCYASSMQNCKCNTQAREGPGDINFKTILQLSIVRRQHQLRRGQTISYQRRRRQSVGQTCRNLFYWCTSLTIISPKHHNHRLRKWKIPTTAFSLLLLLAILSLQ